MNPIVPPITYIFLHVSLFASTISLSKEFFRTSGVKLKNGHLIRTAHVSSSEDCLGICYSLGNCYTLNTIEDQKSRGNHLCEFFSTLRTCDLKFEGNSHASVYFSRESCLPRFKVKFRGNYLKRNGEFLKTKQQFDWFVLDGNEVIYLGEQKFKECIGVLNDQQLKLRIVDDAHCLRFHINNGVMKLLSNQQGGYCSLFVNSGNNLARRTSSCNRLLDLQVEYEQI